MAKGDLVEAFGSPGTGDSFAAVTVYVWSSGMPGSGGGSVQPGGFGGHGGFGGMPAGGSWGGNAAGFGVGGGSQGLAPM